jgi:hypothetical protein
VTCESKKNVAIALEMRLTDMVVRLRSATQALRAGAGSGADPATLREQRAAMLEALDDLAKATGIPPSDLGVDFGTTDDGSSGPP